MRIAALSLAIALSACQEPTLVPTSPNMCDGEAFARLGVNRVEKLDLLLVVDNSPSMADKQAELARRIPELIAALTDRTPDPWTGKPINVPDIHVSVISSSLGSHGTSACAVASTNAHNDDRGHLLPRTGEGGGTGWKAGTRFDDPTAAACPAPIAASPLSWAYDETRDARFKGYPEGASSLQTAASCVVASVKDDGCGYEETWESLYHFLIDPAPYAKAEVKCTFGLGGDACGSNQVVVEGLDEELLAQRKAFLRQDSLLAVIVLSDENDASLKPAGLDWLPWARGTGQMQRGWTSCANVPDDFEPHTAADFTRLHGEYKCFSCFEDASNPNCKLAWSTDPLDHDVDGRNLRAFQQTQRFGTNFLWGRQRYVDAFTKQRVLGSDGTLAANPVFAGGFRDASLVVVATIVGVPKLLVTNDDGTPKSLTDADWEKIAGPIGKRDPHMIESIAPRDGIPVFAGDRFVDPINGGDRHVADGDDLQYACIAPRAEKGKGNDCDGPTPDLKNPLCAADGTQPYFKAYPGLRHLRIVKDLGVSGFVASICNDTYRPAILGIAEQLKTRLGSPCLRSSLTQEPSGEVSCLLFEAMRPDDPLARCEDAPGLCTPGSAPCRKEALTATEASRFLGLPVRSLWPDGTTHMERGTPRVEGTNVVVVGSDHRKHLVCELRQLSGPELAACTTHLDFKLDPAKGGGFCYSTKDELVGEQCKRVGAPGTLRFFGGAEPRSGSEVFMSCGGYGGC